MDARAKLFGHAVHQMLIVFPLGLLATAVIFDLIYLLGGAATWEMAAWYMIAAGIIGGLTAALFGLIDWLGVPANTRARRIGAIHGLGNVLVVLLFLWSWLVRLPHPEHPSTFAFVVSYVGAGLSLITAWLGGELVDRLGIGVDEGANVDAPSSLSGRPAGLGSPRTAMSSAREP
jgi:uncharacterized membrane protein